MPVRKMFEGRLLARPLPAIPLLVALCLILAACGTGEGRVSMPGMAWSSDQDDALRVRDLLDLEVVAEADVVAGEEGLDRVVTGINIIEAPDIWRWMQGGEFLLSAAYPWRDRRDELPELILKLDQAGVSGVAFKLGRWLQELPDELPTLADRLRLPILRFPASVAYRDILESFWGQLMSRREQVADLPVGLRMTLTRVSLDEQSIERLVGTLARQVRNPVYVVDTLDDEVYHADPDGLAIRQSREALDEPTATLIDEILEFDLRRSPTSFQVTAGRVIAVALVVSRTPYGFIAVLQRDTPLSTFVESGLPYAAELVSFLLLKRLSLLEGRREAGSVFFDSLMSERSSNEEAVERALALGLRLTLPCAVLVAGLGESPPVDALQRLRRDVERHLAGIPHVLTGGVNKGRFLLLVQVGDPEVRQRLAERIAAASKRRGCGDVLVGAGSPQIGLEGVRRSRAEASIAFETAQRLGRTGLACFEDLGVERLLAQIPADSASAYVDSVLKGLQERPDLLRTLEVYLQKGGNKVATAAALPLHRSSLAYRLDKISAQLGIDLNDPENWQEVWLALRLRQMYRAIGE